MARASSTSPPAPKLSSGSAQVRCVGVRNPRVHRLVEARDGDAEVVVDLEDLGLVRGELGGRALEGGEDAVGRRLEAGLFVFLRLCTSQRAQARK